ncbi:hypothetical protein [Nocardia sp. NPDC051570]|uniref:hypothetical protein n=1 Tax=Nocardia sp. NPDC051570 TaxID=3364324 RepID=UPI003795EC4E
MDYAAEMDRILADYRAASRTVTDQFLTADARTTREGTAVFDTLRDEYDRPDPEPQPDMPAQPVRADHREPRSDARRPGRADYVLPSDWTEEDEARAEGYGSPNSWLV